MEGAKSQHMWALRPVALSLPDNPLRPQRICTGRHPHARSQQGVGDTNVSPSREPPPEADT